MRIAVLILALVLGIYLIFQSVLITGLSAVATSGESAGGGMIGLIIALLWLVGAAFVIGVPFVSIVVFVLAGLLGVGWAAGTGFRDLQVWGVVSFVLAALSFVGLLTKRRGTRVEDRKQRERDARLAANIRESVSTSGLQQLPPNSVYCASCGQPGPASSKFCAECGAPRSQPGGALPLAGTGGGTS